MNNIRVLIVGEASTIVTTFIEGFDSITTTVYEEGVEWLQNALEGADIEVSYMPTHLAAAKFPTSMDELKSYDVIILSDIGANSLLLHPDTWSRSQPTPNRLDLLGDYVHEGGGLLMIGGYFSFTGFAGRANYKGTSVEQALPVTLLPTDDRVDVPQGLSPDIIDPNHPVIRGINGPWPLLLGYNRVEAKPDATVLLKHDDDPIAAIWEYGRGRAAVFTSDCAPHWAPPQFLNWEGYALFFSQMVRWLAQAH